MLAFRCCFSSIDYMILLMREMLILLPARRRRHMGTDARLWSVMINGADV